MIEFCSANIASLGQLEDQLEPVCNLNVEADPGVVARLPVGRLVHRSSEARASAFKPWVPTAVVC